MIIAISLEPRKLTRVHVDKAGKRVQKNVISNDPGDLTGPPYMVAEHVFDEYDLKGCYASAEDVPD